MIQAANQRVAVSNGPMSEMQSGNHFSQSPIRVLKEPAQERSVTAFAVPVVAPEVAPILIGTFAQ
jgi:hypothetical protein